MRRISFRIVNTTVNKFDFYREEYRYELQRREELQSGINIPLSIVTVLFAALSFFLKSLSTVASLTLVDDLFLILLAFFAVALVGSASYIIRSYVAKKDDSELIADLSVWQRQEIQIYKVFGTDSEGAETFFENELIVRYAEASRVNRKTNIERAQNLSKGKRLIALSTVLFAVCALFYVPETMGVQQPAQRVEVTRPITIQRP